MSEPKAWVFGVGFGVALSRLVEIPDDALMVAVPFLAAAMIAEEMGRG